MGLETAKFIAGLNPEWPLPADGKDQGDDHIRVLKQALQDSFVGFPGAVLVGGTDTGVANAYVLSPPHPLLAYSVNMTVLWLPANTNGGASTINISGLGAQPIRRNDGTPTENGDIMADSPIAMLWNGSEFRLLAITKRYVDQLVYSGVLPGQTNNGGKPLITDGTNAAFSHAFGVAIDECEGAAIPATATLNLASGPGTGNFTHITGSGFSINAMTLPAGAARDLVFDGTGTLVNSSNLVLPVPGSLAVQAGDTLRVRGEGGGAVRVVNYTRKTGRALAEGTPAGLILLGTIVPANGVAAIDALNIFSSGYDDYLVIANDLSNSNGNTSGSDGIVNLLVAKGGVVDAANSYAYAMTGQPGTSYASFFGLQMSIAAGGANQAAGYAEIRFSNVNDADATAFHGIRAESSAIKYRSSGDTSCTAATVMGAHYNAVTGVGAVSGFRLTMTNSTFGATGSIRVYGIRKT